MGAFSLNQKMPFQKRVGRAKPDRKLLQQFAMKQLNINPSTMKLLLAISPYVDIDGQVVISLDKIRRELNMQKKTFNHVLKEAKFNQLLVIKEGAYYSNFHIQATGQGGEMSYVKIYDVFTSPGFLSYSLNEQRLFTFTLTRSIKPTQWQTYNIVQLYTNRKNNKTNGLHIFPTFRELGNALIKLIKNDHIEVKLVPNKSNIGDSIILNSNTKAIEKQFFDFFGKSPNEDKAKEYSRFTLKDIDNQLIRIRVTNSVTSNERKVVASEYELDVLARENYFLASDINSEQKGYMIGYKNELYQVAGETGIKIYRNSLKKFIQDHGFSILTFSDNQKAANNFMNFYILKEIQNLLSGVALHQNILRDSQIKFPELLSNGYIVPVNVIGPLLTFFLKYGSSNHIIRLDRALFSHEINYSTFNLHKSEWQLLKVKTDTIFVKHEAAIGEKFDNYNDFRGFIYECASKGLLIDDKLEKLFVEDSEDRLQKARIELTKVKMKALKDETNDFAPELPINSTIDTPNVAYKDLFRKIIESKI